MLQAGARRVRKAPSFEDSLYERENVIPKHA